jgi:hypothetical protein
MSPQLRAAIKWCGTVLVLLACIPYLNRLPTSLIIGLGGLMIALVLLIFRFPAARLRMGLGVFITLLVVITLAREWFIGASPPALPNDTPAEITQLDAGYDRLGIGSDSFVVFYTGAESVRLRIDFAPVRTLAGFWAYRRARVGGSDNLPGIFDADPTYIEEMWGDYIETEDQRESWDAYPFLHVELPLAQQHVHQWITLRASMRLTYPESVDDDYFEERIENLNRDVSVFVGSTADRSTRLIHDEWLRQTENLRGGAPFILSLGAFGLVLAGSAVPSFVQAVQAARLRDYLRQVGLVAAPRARRLGRHNGLLITDVYPDSPAQRVDLRQGDVLIRVDDQPITTLSALVRRVGAWQPGEEHTVIVLRGQQPMVLTLML